MFREAIRTQPEIFTYSLDYVLIVSADAAQATWERIQEEVRDLFREAAARWASELESS
jgi:ribonuclease P protein component